MFWYKERGYLNGSVHLARKKIRCGSPQTHELVLGKDKYKDPNYMHENKEVETPGGKADSLCCEFGIRAPSPSCQPVGCELGHREVQ